MAARYYVNCKVLLRLRFEDFLDLPPVPSAPVGAGAEAFAFNPAEVVPVIPYSCSVTLNSYREADTARIVIPFERMPIDPRILRAAGVQVFAGAVAPDTFADGYPISGSASLPIIPDSEFGVSNEIFRGFADDWELTLDGDQPMIQMSCRDTTSIFIDAEVPPNLINKIPPTLPLDQVLRLILLDPDVGLPGARGMVVVNQSGINPLPGLGEFHAPSWFDSKRTAKRGRAGGAKTKISYWDFITDVVTAAGLFCYVRPSRTPQDVLPIPLGGAFTFVPAPPAELVISQPRTYYRDRVGLGDLPAPEEWVLAYGLNVDNLTIKRNLTGYVTPTIEVRSFDTRTSTPIVARFPEAPPKTPKKNNQPRPSAVGDREEVKVITVNGLSGVKGRQIARAYARSIYEQLGRNEVELGVRTRHLTAKQRNLDAIARGDEPVADLFWLRPGDPVALVIRPIQSNAGDLELGTQNTAAFIANASVVEQEALFRALAFPPAATVKVLQSLTFGQQKVQREFRCRTVVWNWDYNSGWDAEITAHNYLDVRNAVSFGEPLDPINGVP